ncbi:MAG: hypothetical protein AAF763_01660 [Pseudomonadota bacterium]
MTAAGPLDAEMRTTWYWSAMNDAVAIYGFELPLVEEVSLKAASAAGRRYKEGEDLGEDTPTRLWVRKGRESEGKRRLPHAFKAGDYVILSSKAADVLGGFDLGAARLSPIQLLKHDHATPFEGDWLLCTPANLKKGFDPDHTSPDACISYNDPNWPVFGTLCSGHAVDDEIALRPSVLSGPDIWLDPSIGWGGLFVSGVLADALRRHRVVGKTKLARCRLVTIH